MRICIVCAESMADGYAPSAHVNGIADALRGLGHQITIIGEDSGPYHDAGLIGRLMRYAKVNRRAKAMLDASDVMLARAHFAHLPWVNAAARCGVPVVHEMNGLMFDAATTYPWLRPAQILINRSYRAQFKQATGVACVTEEIAAHVNEQVQGVPVSIVGNGVDSTIFYPPDTPPSTDMFAIFPSALAPWHGINTLLAAVDDPAWPDGLSLVIAGDGVQTDTVMRRAALNPRIRYVGLLGRRKLAAHLRSAAIGLCLVETMAHRGVSEVYPLKLFELMATGLPIVATDLPGQRDVVLSSGAGLVVPVEDAAALARAVRDLMSRTDRWDMGRAGMQAVHKLHDWRMRGIELERFLRKAVLAPSVLSPSELPV